MLQNNLAKAIVEEADDKELNAAYDALQAHVNTLWAQQALYNKPLDSSKPRYFRTGRDARRAAMRGYGLKRPERSRCTRSAAKRGVRKVYSG